ncbi:hypothetical protein KY284_032445 [Solanum tuberosum]|nr:hypothetical protein KY284_032445 [Solanum tuberosum]
MANGCWEEERRALLELQENIMSSNGELLVDWAGYNANGFIDCCFWKKVKCSLETGRVIKLDLAARYGSGDDWRFKASLFLPFKSLQVLLLSKRNIIGWTKNEGFSKLRQLPNLKKVDLQYNPIHPKVLLSSLCSISSLEVLKLGMVSKICGVLTNLRELKFRGYGINDINILFALDIIALRNLKYLNLWNNNMESFVTSKALRNLSMVEYLYLDGSSLNDNFLANIGQMTSLKVLSMPAGENNGTLPNQDGNQLSGKFPTWLLENNTRLAGIYGDNNAFNGPFKLPLNCLLHLETIDVSNNNLNGPIPENMSLAFPKLTSLNMSQNYLEGPIPSKISGIHLEILDLSANTLSGEVPSDLTIGSPQLFYLRLSNNKLKGRIFSEEVRPHLLSFLYLNDNNFEGALPSNIFLSSLVALDASRNNFSGEIPGCIRDNRRLLQLDLSKNHFDGSIPVEICNLKLIRVLAISENRLSGFIPSCMSSLPLEHIHLERNQLGGTLVMTLLVISVSCLLCVV